jgi:hypothetical protein
VTASLRRVWFLIFNLIIRDQIWWKSNNYANMTCCDVTCKVQWQTAEYKLAESTSFVYIIDTLGFIHCHKHESEPL